MKSFDLDFIFIKTMALFGILELVHLQSHRWNHYHKCAINISRNIWLRMESKWAVLYVSDIATHNECREIEIQCLCLCMRYSETNEILKYIFGARNNWKEANFVRCAVHTHKIILNVLQFIPTTFVFHENKHTEDACL